MALMMPNCHAYVVALIGVMRAGMAAVNVNPLYTPRELEHQLKDSGAEVLLVMENLRTRWRRCWRRRWFVRWCWFRWGICWGH